MSALRALCVPDQHWAFRMDHKTQDKRKRVFVIGSFMAQLLLSKGDDLWGKKTGRWQSLHTFLLSQYKFNLLCTA